jgi:hypothetical protein
MLAATMRRSAGKGHSLNFTLRWLVGISDAIARTGRYAWAGLLQFEKGDVCQIGRKR